MGEFMMQGGLSRELYNTVEKWIYRFPGGLAQVNIVACSIFAAISGSSVSTAATMGVLAGPEMEKRGYDNRLTYGSLAAGGTLGILIPPSIPMILYGR
jgi:C4-dicarboxylate transporter DctM subunit